ncbi:MAG TPA: GDSL-type esterase/lipase family protein [Vicinamibacterales bacterium]
MSHARSTVRRSVTVAILAVVHVLAAVSLLAQVAPRDPARWEPDVAAFENQDRRSPPHKGGIVFVGASSIVRWNVAQFFPDLNVLNRGFGGSEMADTTHFAARTVLPYEPRIVVLYPGENDIARGVSPETVAAGFERLVTTVHSALPKTRILVIGLKPTPARWRFNDRMIETNRLLRAIAARSEQITYISVEKAMLGPDKLPRPDLFIGDGQHMTQAGYEIWTDIVRPHLK